MRHRSLGRDAHDLRYGVAFVDDLYGRSVAAGALAEIDQRGLPLVGRFGYDARAVDMREFARMNAVYERMFAGHKPARTTIQAAALPGEGLRVEIDCIACIPDGA